MVFVNYTTFSEPPVIPKKFKPNTLTGENQEQIKTREELVCDKIRCEANIMKILSENYATKLARVTDEIAKEIYKTYDEESEIAKLLLEERKKDCRKEEEVSERIWKEKRNLSSKKNSKKIQKMKKTMHHRQAEFLGVTTTGINITITNLPLVSEMEITTTIIITTISDQATMETIGMLIVGTTEEDTITSTMMDNRYSVS